MSKKMICKIIPILFVLCILLVNVYASGSSSSSSNFGNGFHPEDIPTGHEGVTKLEAPVQRAWGTISLILQVCAVGGIIFAGVRYMFAGPDAKGDIKKTLPYIVIGLVIVFASTFVIDFVVEIFNETVGK